MFHNHCDRDDSTGVGALMFAMVCFTIMVFSFAVAFAALHLWAISTLLLRLTERRWVMASWWASVLGVLVYIDWHIWI